MFPANVTLDWKVFARCKHSSLFGLIISNEEKKFFNIDTRFRSRSFCSVPPYRKTRKSCSSWTSTSRRCSRRVKLIKLIFFYVANAAAEKARVFLGWKETNPSNIVFSLRTSILTSTKAISVVPPGGDKTDVQVFFGFKNVCYLATPLLDLSDKVWSGMIWNEMTIKTMGYHSFFIQPFRKLRTKKFL